MMGLNAPGKVQTQLPLSVIADYQEQEPDSLPGLDILEADD